MKTKKYKFLHTTILCISCLFSFFCTQTNAQNKEIPIEFETISTIRNISPTEVFPGTFYYSNADDNPTETPTVGTDNNIKYIEAKAIKGDSKGVKSTIATLNRWVKVPENPPERIKITFKTRVTKNTYFDWTMPSEGGSVRRSISLGINFLREDGLKGGGVSMGTKTLTEELNKWVEHSEILTVPKGAAYLHISIVTCGGYNLALGDWRIE